MTSNAIIVTDYGFGDFGKGKTVAAYARHFQAHTAIRFCSGPQAVHNVVTDDGRTHGFSQFCSATFEGARTYLSRFMTVSPTHLIEEAGRLESLGVQKPMDLIAMDRNCPIVTLYHRAANWLKELARGDAAHGTCGMGIGELAADILNEEEDVIYAGDLQDMRTLIVKTRRLRNRKRDELEDVIHLLKDTSDSRIEIALRILDEDSAMASFLENGKTIGRQVAITDESFLHSLLKREGTVIFEGAQGVLLDENFGFHPHTTWSKTTRQQADILLDECGYNGKRFHLAGFRTYSTRHGAGPFPTNDPLLKARFHEPHNSDKNWQGLFRVGWFDLVMARYALSVGGSVDGLAITHLDTITKTDEASICIGYRYSDSLDDTRDLFDIITIDGEEIIINIRPGVPGNLEHQHRIGMHLSQCRPILQTMPSDTILTVIEHALGHPIAMTSHGPETSATAFYNDLIVTKAA